MMNFTIILKKTFKILAFLFGLFCVLNSIVIISLFGINGNPLSLAGNLVLATLMFYLSGTFKRKQK
jgi:hypothetical protein